MVVEVDAMGAYLRELLEKEVILISPQLCHLGDAPHRHSPIQTGPSLLAVGEDSNFDLVEAPLRKLIETHRTTCNVVTPTVSGLVLVDEPRCQGEADSVVFACEQQCTALLERAKMLNERYPKELFL